MQPKQTSFILSLQNLQNTDNLAGRTQMPNIKINVQHGACTQTQVYSSHYTLHGGQWGSWTGALAETMYRCRAYLWPGSPSQQHNHPPLHHELLWTKQMAFTIPGDKPRGMCEINKQKAEALVELILVWGRINGHACVSWRIMDEVLVLWVSLSKGGGTSGYESCTESMKREITCNTDDSLWLL